MSSYYQKGRADAAKGKFAPPKHGFFPESKAEHEEKEQWIQ